MNQIMFLWNHCDFTNTEIVLVVVILVQPILSMEFHSGHFFHCSFVVSLSCSNFCWSFLPHWQISGKSLFSYRFYRGFLKLCQMQLKMNYLLFLLCIIKRYRCLKKSREKILGHFAVEVIHIISLKFYICWQSALLLLPIRCTDQNILHLSSLSNLTRGIYVAPGYLFNDAFSHQMSWSCMCNVKIKVMLQAENYKHSCIKYSQGTPKQSVALLDWNLWYRFDSLNIFSKRHFENFAEFLVFLSCSQNRPISGLALRANCWFSTVVICIWFPWELCKLFLNHMNIWLFPSKSSWCFSSSRKSCGFSSEVPGSMSACSHHGTCLHSNINALIKLYFNIWKTRMKKVLLHVKLEDVTLAYSVFLQYPALYK